jgi:hypothetical protein
VVQSTLHDRDIYAFGQNGKDATVSNRAVLVGIRALKFGRQIDSHDPAKPETAKGSRATASSAEEIKDKGVAIPFHRAKRQEPPDKLSLFLL